MMLYFEKQARTRLSQRLAMLATVAKHAWLVGAILLFLAPFSFAQVSTAVLGGEVFDAQHRAVQNAVVTVTSDDTGVHWTAKTNETGSWRVNALPVGRYHFEVVAPEFQTLDYPSLKLDISDQRFIDVVLSVGSTSSTITVQAEEPVLDTTSAVSGTVLYTKDMDELPNTDNSASGYAILTPGVTYGGSGWGVWAQNQLSQTIQESAYSVNGAGGGSPSSSSLNFALDGAVNSNPTFGNILAYNPQLDAVQEIRMTTNAYDASIGRTQTGTLNETLKSGTKDFHGDLYEINENNFANATSYGYQEFGITAPPIIRFNEYGGTAGGPVWIPKLYDGRKKGTFFFFAYDGIRNVSPYATGTINVPTALERKGDFSKSYTTSSVNGVPTVYPIQLFDPTTAAGNGGIRQPIPNDMLPTTTAEAQALDALIPLPNAPGDGASSDSNNYVINDPLINHFNQWSLRVDQAWNNSNHTYLEYRHNNTRSISDDPFGPNSILSGLVGTSGHNGLTVSHAWVISQNFLLSATGNASSNPSSTYRPFTHTNPADYDFPSQMISEQTSIGIPSIGTVFDFGNGDNDNWSDYYNYEGSAFLQQIWKNHTFHYGVDYLVQQESVGDRNCGAGCYSFSGIWTLQNPQASSQPVGYGSSWADWLLGLPASGNENNDATAYWSQPYMGYYVQDDWRVTPKWTINVGMRWDYQLGLTERHNKYWSRYDPNVNLTDVTNYIQPLYAAALSGSDPGAQLIQAYGPTPSNFIARGGVEYAGVNGIPRTLSDPEPNYWQPRIGFAYQIRPTTVIRGGYGRFVGANFNTGIASQTGYSTTTPFTATTDDYITPYATLANPYPNGLVPQTGNSQGIYTDAGAVTSFFPRGIKRPMTDDFSLHLQQEWKDFLVEIGGVYEHSSELQAGTYLPGQCCNFGTNIGVPSIAAFEAAYKPEFDSTGAPVTTLPGDTQVPNPFYGAPYVTNGLQTSTTISAYQLILPYPLQGSGYMQNNFNGKSDHYAFESQVQHHLKNGFFLSYAFHWGKQMDTLAYVTNPVYSQKLLRELSGNDQRFQHTVAVTYTLPFGKGKWFLGNSNRLLDSAVGGWELSGVYNMYSGPPIALPTNSAFFEGGDPGLGSKKSYREWFNISKFYPFPNESTTTTQLASYPSWTKVMSLPGAGWTPPSPSGPQQNGVYNDFHTWSTNYPVYYGDVRNPYFQTFNLGLRKSFTVWRETKLQLRMDALNALNHVIFQGYYSTNVSSPYFGYINGTNDNAGWQWNTPRVIELEGKFYF